MATTNHDAILPERAELKASQPQATYFFLTFLVAALREGTRSEGSRSAVTPSSVDAYDPFGTNSMFSNSQIVAIMSSKCIIDLI